MKKILIPAIIIVIAIIVVFVFIKKDTGVKTSVLPNQENNLRAPLLSFKWEFEKASTLNLDGQPQTNVYLLATYKNNLSDRKLIDTVDGSCSELPPEYKGGSNSENIQCYAAGLGQQYRITTGATSYLIERKLFEEALPDSEPIDYKWELITEFALTK